ncbi:MAG: IS110 family transposase [Bacteroidetes bacterium]|nr:IS110 family transposase [Bacteroidota bacterium]
MNYYKKQHKYYCGIDLHARKMYVCILDHTGKKQVHKNIRTDPELLFEIIFPYLEDIVIGVECVFCWYWLSDLCSEHNIPFILGHALYMKSIHGGKTKNDKIDSSKIASLIRGGNFPLAYNYPSKMRATRDLLRRRMYLVRKNAELLAHIQNTRTQYNMPEFNKRISRRFNHKGVAELFADPSVRKSVEVDLTIIEAMDKTLRELEWFIEKTAKSHDSQTLYLLRTIPGIGLILGLVILYEINNINRFSKVQKFSSYSMLFRPVKESGGKRVGISNGKIGNHHLKWAIKEASIIFLRESDQAKKYVAKLEKKYNKGKALGILAHKLGRIIYYMLKNKKPFDAERFLST